MKAAPFASAIKSVYAAIEGDICCSFSEVLQGGRSSFFPHPGISHTHPRLFCFFLRCQCGVSADEDHRGQHSAQPHGEGFL